MWRGFNKIPTVPPKLRTYCCVHIIFSAALLRLLVPDSCTGSLPEALGNLEALQEVKMDLNQLGGESQ